MPNTARPPKVSLLVAHQIIADVVRSGLKPGTSLPPERAMLETYQIGRGTLREALRLLEFQGVIALKPGPRGGPVLMRPDAAFLSSSLSLLMHLSDAPFRTTIEARLALEPMISRLAADRMTDTELAELRACLDEMNERTDDERSFLETNRRFHSIIAWGSGNALFGYLVDSLSNILDGTALGIDYPRHRRQAIQQAHERIYGALSTHDPAAAETLMEQHTEAYLAFAKRRYPELLDRVIPWDLTLGRSGRNGVTGAA